jgi:protein TonB
MLLISALCNAQTKKTDPQNDPQNMAIKTDQEPFFPKGEMELFNLVSNGITYSDSAKAKYVAGDVMLSFDVMPDSTISNVVVISGPGYGIDEAVKNYVQKLKFAPAIQSGVKVRMNLMMNFPVKAH